ncbi:hypothetical protein ATCC90586_009438 [Pythium insidiosum]|nr:hypothetical protein ATCC90586_009438 [Pythium insidiosum]
MSYNRDEKKATRQLFDACERGDTKAVEALVNHQDVKINWHCPQSYGATALIAATANGHIDVVQILLEKGAALGELKTPDRNSPLHEAAIRDQPEIMSMILRRIQEMSNQAVPSSLIDLQNQFGNTPLHNAARTGSVECVAYLLEAGARADLKNVNGSLALHHACYCDKPNLRIVKRLVEAGSDVNHQDNQGFTPLMVAAKKNQTDIIDYLRSHGADVQARNQFGEDAMHFAMLRDNRDAMQLLDVAE